MENTDSGNTGIGPTINPVAISAEFESPTIQTVAAMPKPQVGRPKKAKRLVKDLLNVLEDMDNHLNAATIDLDRALEIQTKLRKLLENQVVK